MLNLGTVVREAPPGRKIVMLISSNGRLDVLSNRPTKDVPFKDLLLSSPARNGEREIADHPSLKPQAFMRQIVRASLPLGFGTILDPFMGTDATIAAARACGLRSIGVEANPRYYKMAVSAVPKLADYVVSNPVEPNAKNGSALRRRHTMN